MINIFTWIGFIFVSGLVIIAVIALGESIRTGIKDEIESRKRLKGVPKAHAWVRDDGGFIVAEIIINRDRQTIIKGDTKAASKVEIITY